MPDCPNPTCPNRDVAQRLQQLIQKIMNHRSSFNSAVGFEVAVHNQQEQARAQTNPPASPAASERAPPKA